MNSIPKYGMSDYKFSWYALAVVQSDKAHILKAQKIHSTKSALITTGFA